MASTHTQLITRHSDESSKENVCATTCAGPRSRPLPPHRDQLAGDDIELFGGLLDSFAFVRGFDLTKLVCLAATL